MYQSHAACNGTYVEPMIQAIFDSFIDFDASNAAGHTVWGDEQNAAADEGVYGSLGGNISQCTGCGPP